ncbi:PH domain-containing protein [Bacillus sp. SCS-153A]|uniref:PH domain-containing protein n=1 Tax=Rossellomorea sedimentorum TaxID=3115294 RepID=UPI0039059555
MRKVKSPITSPSLSINRLEIHYQKYEVIHTSPKEDEVFINCLIKMNPKVRIENQ